jgi:ubiquinone/menaquinone biosynthesis C-methylase UbiE
MGNLVNYISSLHKSTHRSYLDRMNDQKVECMLEAKKYGEEYWDGSRRFGYGGYKYIKGRWKPVAEILIQKYNLDNNSKILDVGCGKGFLLYEIKLLLPKIEVRGFDSSKYALDNSKEEVKQNLFCHQAQEVYPFQDKEYDLTISINTLHNLKIFDLSKALKEIQRVSKNSYICVESFRNDLELFNLECWALTCQSFFSPDEWIWIYNQFGYQGDYEFIYFE